MKMKYFRFLYGEITSCMMHFGEVNDTRSNETMTFLFFRGSAEQTEQMERKQKSPFLFPESVDLVVLGNVNESVKQVWNEIQQQVKVRTLIVPDTVETENLCLGQVDEVIRLCPKCRATKTSEQSSEVLSGISQWHTVKAGWNLQVRCWKEGALALWHDLYTEQMEMKPFTDCVMSVKAVENSLCCEKQKPDAYGCAVGCAIHRDCDVCKFRDEKRTNPYLTGTFLAAGIGEEEEERELRDWLSENIGGARFVSMQNLEGNAEVLIGDKNMEPGMRRYYVEMNGEVNDQTIAELCRAGFGSMPVILSKEHSVCCAGFLKYAEA